MTSRFSGPTVPVLFCLCGLVVSAGCSSGTVEDTAAADATLKQFSDFFKGAEAYQVHSRVEMVVTDTQGKQHGELSPPVDERTIAVERPKRFAFTSVGGVGIVSDGSSLTAWSKEGGKYWHGGASFSMADLMNSHVGSFIQNPLYVRPLLWAGSDPTSVLTLGLGKTSYIGRETVDGRPAHHLRTPGVWEQGQDLTTSPILDFWIAAEGDPVPLKLALKRPPQEVTGPDGKPIEVTMEMVETFTDWDFAVPPADQFAASRPEGLRRVLEIEDVLSPEHPLVGRPAPEVNLPILDGEKLRLADLAGKVVILDFWATWCQPCLQELPVMLQVASDYQDRSVVLYAVNQVEKEFEVRLFLARTAIPATIALDTEGTASAAYQAETIPQLVLIGKDGTVQAIHAGFGPGLEERVRLELDALVDGIDLAHDGLPEPAEE